MIELLQTLTTYPSASDLLSVTIQRCYYGDTYTTSDGEKSDSFVLILLNQEGRELIQTLPVQQDYLNDLIAGSTVTISRIRKIDMEEPSLSNRKVLCIFKNLS